MFVLGCVSIYGESAARGSSDTRQFNWATCGKSWSWLGVVMGTGLA